jgi:uncharacterized protein YcfJ
LFSACASEPIIDRQGVDPIAYERDLADCERYADEVRVAQKAGSGAVAGAVLGGIIGAVVGNSNTAGEIAGVGAVHGAAQGTAGGLRERKTVVRTCLRNRGYAVLN